MSKTSSDPYCTSSNCSLAAGKSHEETYKAIQKLSRQREASLIRAPSMPPCLESNPVAKGSSDLGRRKSKAETGDLAEESQDEEIEFSMGRLIRQASLKSSDSMPLRKHAAADQGVTTISSRMKQEYDRRKLERLRPRRVMKTQKSSSDLEWDELKSFKHLGFNPGPTNLNQEDDSAPLKSPEDDMKAQIKFWARAVASNCAKNAD